MMADWMGGHYDSHWTGVTSALASGMINKSGQKVCSFGLNLHVQKLPNCCSLPSWSSLVLLWHQPFCGWHLSHVHVVDDGSSLCLSYLWPSRHLTNFWNNQQTTSLMIGENMLHVAIRFIYTIRLATLKSVYEMWPVWHCFLDWTYWTRARGDCHWNRVHDHYFDFCIGHWWLKLIMANQWRFKIRNETRQQVTHLSIFCEVMKS